MSKILLREFYSLCADGSCEDLLTEDEKKIVKNGGMIIPGLLQQSDMLNHNGRIYPHKVLAREVENYKKAVRERRAYGELDHSEDPVINLRNVSHLIREIWMDGNKVMGKIEILNTPSGQILQSILKSGGQVGMSSRALGSLKETPQGSIVEDDLALICFDAVSQNSTPNAFLTLRESKMDTRKVFTKADRIYRLLNDIVRK